MLPTLPSSPRVCRHIYTRVFSSGPNKNTRPRRISLPSFAEINIKAKEEGGRKTDNTGATITRAEGKELVGDPAEDSTEKKKILVSVRTVADE